MHLVLQTRDAGADRRPRVDTPNEKATRRQTEELKLVLSQLGALLDDQPEIRKAMRHLAFVERALAKAGFQALSTMPRDLLQHALQQLEGLVINWSPAGLAALRSKMAVAVIDLERTPTTTQTPREEYRSTFPLGLDDAANLPTVQVHSDQATLSAVYAALGSAAPAGVDTSPAPA
jgi:DNA-binding PucR family transcriptional regulator